MAPVKALVLDSVSSSITRRGYNLRLDEFIAWFADEPRPVGFSKTIRKLAVEAAHNGLLAPSWPLGSLGLTGAGRTASGSATCCPSASDNRWCTADLIGKYGRVRTVPMPTFVVEPEQPQSRR